MNNSRNAPPPSVHKEAMAALNYTVPDWFLFARIQQAHWNVRGTTLIGLNKLLEEFADRTMNRIHLASGRATVLGGMVKCTLRESVKHLHVKKKADASSVRGMSDWIHTLADVYAEAGEHVRKAIKKMPGAEDFRTADLLTDTLQSLDLQFCLLEAHINRQQP
jgi:starvation-inducible DNA-binding protein